MKSGDMGCAALAVFFGGAATWMLYRHNSDATIDLVVQLGLIPGVIAGLVLLLAGLGLIHHFITTQLHKRSIMRSIKDGTFKRDPPLRLPLPEYTYGLSCSGVHIKVHWMRAFGPTSSNWMKRNAFNSHMTRTRPQLIRR